MNSICVCILYFEKPGLTIKSIESVIKSGVPVYVLNNASSASGWGKVKSKFGTYSNIRFIESDVNLGPAGGRNRLILESKETWLLFLDNDIHIKTKNWHKIITNHTENNKETEAFIPRLYNVHEKSYSNFHKYVINNNEIRGIPLDDNENETNFFPGGASMVNRKVFEQFGMYDENLFVLEDLEFPIRHLLKGKPIKAKLINDIVLIHKHVYTKRKEDQAAALVRYSSERNKFAQEYICKKHNINFNSYWEEWVNRQIYLITRNNGLRKIKNYFVAKLKRSKNKN